MAQVIWTPAERMTTVSPTPPSKPRLDMEPTGTPGALLDGAWWPRSADPVAELPGLILTLDELFNPVTRMMLRKGDWESRPLRLRVDRPATGGTGGPAAARVVRLGWFETMPKGLLTVFCLDGHRVDLLTVPADTGETVARKAMELAARGTEPIHAPDILAAAASGRRGGRPARKPRRRRIPAAGSASDQEPSGS